MDLHPTTKAGLSGHHSAESADVAPPPNLDALLHEIPELAQSIVSLRVGVIRYPANAPDGEGGEEPIADLTEPFAIAMAGEYERGATMIPAADDAPQSLRTQLVMLDEYLSAARQGPPPAGGRAAPREFDSPLTESVARWLNRQPRANRRVERAVVPTAAPPPAESLQVVEPGSFPPPPPLPRFPLGPAAVTEQDSSDISSLSPVSAVAEDELAASARHSARQNWYAAALGGLSVAAAAALFLWTPFSRPTTAPAVAAFRTPAAIHAAETVLAKPPVRLPDVPVTGRAAVNAPLDPRVANAVMIVGGSAALVCASGAPEPRDAHVVVSFDPSGTVSARVTSPIDSMAARCVEQAFSRQRTAPFEGEPTTRSTTVRLVP